MIIKKILTFTLQIFLEKQSIVTANYSRLLTENLISFSYKVSFFFARGFVLITKQALTFIVRKIGDLSRG